MSRSTCLFLGVHGAVRFLHQRAEPLGVRFGPGGPAQRTHVLAQIRARHTPVAVLKVVGSEHDLTLAVVFAETAKHSLTLVA